MSQIHTHTRTEQVPSLEITDQLQLSLSYPEAKNHQDKISVRQQIKSYSHSASRLVLLRLQQIANIINERIIIIKVIIENWKLCDGKTSKPVDRVLLSCLKNQNLAFHVGVSMQSTELLSYTQKHCSAISNFGLFRDSIYIQRDFDTLLLAWIMLTPF